MFSRLRFQRTFHLGSRLSHRHPHRGGFRIEDELAEFLEHPKTASLDDDTKNSATSKNDKKSCCLFKVQVILLEVVYY